MSDINWNENMKDCPNDVTVLIADDDGTFRLIEAKYNDTPWNLYYPVKKKEPHVTYPEKWARVA